MKPSILIIDDDEEIHCGCAVTQRPPEGFAHTMLLDDATGQLVYAVRGHQMMEGVLGDEWQHQPWRLPAGLERHELHRDPVRVVLPAAPHRRLEPV